MENLIIDDFKNSITDVKHYSCTTFMSPVVYFRNDPDVCFTKENVKVRVGVKEALPPMTVYCSIDVDEQAILEVIVVKRCRDSIEKTEEHTKAMTGRECH